MFFLNAGVYHQEVGGGKKKPYNFSNVYGV